MSALPVSNMANTHWNLGGQLLMQKLDAPWYECQSKTDKYGYRVGRNGGDHRDRDWGAPASQFGASLPRHWALGSGAPLLDQLSP